MIVSDRESLAGFTNWQLMERGWRLDLMGYSWIKLTQDEFGREGAKQSFALALIVMMFAGVFAFILPSPAAADSWTDTTTENFALGTHENTESVGDNVRLENIGVGIHYTQGRFTSQAFDAGQVVENWDNISWTVTTPSLTKQENDNVGAEPPTLIDGDSRIGVVQTGTSYEDTRDNDGVYENIQENNLRTPITDSYYEVVTVVVSGDNLSSPDKLDADDGDNHRVSAESSVENADYYMTLEPNPLVDGENSRIGVITGGSITDVQTQNNVYENIQENNIGAPTTTQENAALTVVVSGDNLSALDKLNADDGDNYRVDAVGTAVEVNTYDYSSGAGADKWAYEGALNAYLPTPPAGTEFTSYTEISTSNDNRYSTGGGTASSDPYHMFKFTISEAPGDITQLDIEWEGYNDEVGTTSELHIWDFTLSAWELLFSHAQYTTDGLITVSKTTGISDYIDASGYLWLCAQDASNYGITICTDYVKVTVTISTVYFLEVQHDSAAFSIPTGSTIENVRVRLNFGSDNTATYTLEIRDWQNSEWDILNTETVASGTEVTWDSTLTTNPDNYISTTDNIRVRLRTDSIENDHISKEDYLQFYLGYRIPEYGLRWEHRVTGLPANGTVYVKIYGYAEAGENFGIYTWDGTNDQWVYSGQNLPSGAAAEGWVEYSVPLSYREDDNLSIMYLSADNTDATPENIHIDYARVRVTTTTYSIDLQHDSEPVSYSGILNNIRVRLKAGSENTATYTLQIRDWQNSEWDNLETVVINNGTEYTFDNILTVDPEYYISVTDNIRVRLITATTENDHIIHEDYLVYEVNYTPTDYAIRWEHRIENVATSYDNFWVRVRGYTSGDSEKVGVYIWDNNASSWEFLDNLTTTEKTITKQMAGSGITQYLRGDNLSIKYEDYDNTDDDQTTVHIDLCIVQAENFYTTEIKFQVATSADNSIWSNNLGPDGTTSTYFTTSPTSLGNIGDNRYFRYIAYFSTGYNTITPVLHDLTINYTLPLPAPDAPTLYLPADGTYTNDNTPYFEWTVGANVDNHRLLIDNDADFSSPEENVLLGATDNTYTISAPGLADGNYSWKVIAINADGENESSIWTFVIDTVATSIPTPYLPADGTSMNTNTVYFEWSSIADAENYDLFIDDDSDFFSPEVSVTVTDNYYTTSLSLEENYKWRVIARDAVNNVSDNSATWTFRVDTVAPSAPTPYLPADGTVTNDNTVYFEWSSIADAENYDLFVDNDSDFSSPEVSVTVTDNYYTSSALPEENYSWRVRARDSVNNVSDNSATWTFLIDIIAPAKPTLVSLGDNAVGSTLTQTFTWTDPEAGVTYDIQIDNETSFTSPYVHENTGLADNSYIYTFASDGVYYWRVRAVDAANNPSSWADYFKFTILAPPGQPPLYLLTDGAITNDNTPTLEWTADANADNHRLLVDNNSDFSSPEENRIVLDNYYTIADENSLLDDNYSWKVIAINARGENESLTWTFLIDTIAPATPTLVSPDNDAVESALTQTFTWTEPEAGVTYDIQIDNETSFTSPYVHENTGLADNSYIYTFASGGVYYWRVRAVDAANNPSSWADYFKFTILGPPGQPTLNLPADGTTTNDSTPYLEWTVGENADSHRLLVDDDADFSSPEENVLLGATNNTYTISAGLADDNYSWKVIAINAIGENESSTWTFVIDTVVPSPPTTYPIILETVLPPLEGALTVTIGTITAGGSGSADFTRHEITVTGVRITTTRDVSGARVDVKMHPAKPAGVEEIASPVYIYFDLSTTVGPDYIDGATIKFKVPRSWIAEMDIDEGTIRLLRYRGAWQRLPSEIIGADSTYFHYEATTSGFSMFAVAGEPMVAPTSTPSGTPTPWDTPTVPSPTQSPPFLYAALFMTAGVVGLGVAYRFARPSRYFVMLKRLKQLGREPIRTRARHIGVPLPEPQARAPGQVSEAELAALRRLEQIGQEQQLRKRRSWINLS